MNASFEVFGLSTGIIRSGDPIALRVIAAARKICGCGLATRAADE